MDADKARFAREADQADEFARLRKEFLFPKHKQEDVIYFAGNSLGLQPVKAKKYLEEELEDWHRFGVEGHTESRRPWVRYHEFFSPSLARVVGAKEREVVAMGGLTNNLHLLLVSFYRPQGKRYKILCEQKAFPSDQYALASQVRFHGHTPEDAMIEVAPREGENNIREEDIQAVLEKYGDEIALMLIGGVNYYTGQVFDMQKLTKSAKNHGITVGWDLAHAAGNVPLQLHHWDVDFAAWCSYKYLNSGPGSVAAIFVHEKHHEKKGIPRFEGWWGHNKTSRFAMPDRFDPIASAEAWQLSNAPVFAMAPLRASLDLFDLADLDALYAKGLALSKFLREITAEVAEGAGQPIEIITPKADSQRGCQLSVLLPGQGKELFNKLLDAGVIADWREPHVIRMAPVPMYNSFTDIYRFGEILKNLLLKTHS